MSREGHGTSIRAIRDAVKNPLRVKGPNSRGGTTYVGKNAHVILNEAGKVITAFPKNRFGRRF